MQRVIKLLRKGCCIFVGAGIPKLIGFPTWQEVAKKMLEYTWNSKSPFDRSLFNLSDKQELEYMISREELKNVLTSCKDRFRENGKIEDYYRKLEKLFYDERKYKNIQNDGYAELLKLSERSFFVQTNVDLSLEKYIKNYRDIKIFVNTSLPIVDSDIPVSAIVYLHGVITDRDSLVFTEDEYNAFYQKNENFKTFLRRVFATYDVFFLGYGLSDKEILDAIVKSDTKRSRFLALGKTARGGAKNKIFSSRLKNHYGIEVIEYDTEEGPEKIMDFLGRLSHGLKEPLSVALPQEDRSKP